MAKIGTLETPEEEPPEEETSEEGLGDGD